MATSVVHDKIVIDLTSDTSSDSGDSDSGSVLTVYTNWPTGHEDEDEAAEKIYTCLQGKLEDHSEDFSIFQKVPFSELPVLFEVPENVASLDLCNVGIFLKFESRSSFPTCSRYNQQYRPS
jgi:hypothetical protein